jgi:acyl-CoA dehydrogenase
VLTRGCGFAEIAHQMHGAIGFTHEHSLHRLTRRLWAWRDEFGTESWWSLEPGREVAAEADALWPRMLSAEAMPTSRCLPSQHQD